MIVVAVIFACFLLIFFMIRLTDDDSMAIYTQKSFQIQTQQYDASTPGGLININTATAEELQELPGIGESLAEQIVRYRKLHGPFEHKSDLKKVKGIGDAKYDELKSMITLEDDR